MSSQKPLVLSERSKEEGRFDFIVSLGALHGADTKKLETWLEKLQQKMQKRERNQDAALHVFDAYDAALAAISAAEWSVGVHLLFDVLEQRPTFVEAWHNLGSAYFGAGQAEDAKWATYIALWLYERAMDEDPDDPYPKFWAASCHIMLGQKPFAILLLKEVFEQEPSYIDELYSEPDFASVLAYFP